MSTVDDPCVVMEMPEFSRGVAVAYCDPPGLLDYAASLKLDSILISDLDAYDSLEDSALKGGLPARRKKRVTPSE